MKECTVEQTYEEAAILNWYKARKAFAAGMVIIDPTSKFPRLEKPELLDALAAAEETLVAIARDIA